MPGIDSYAKLVLHCNGVDGSTTFTDSSDSAHTITAVGNAQIDTAESKFGGASGLLDGTGDYLTIPSSTDFDMGSGDFTYEMWVKATATGTIGNFFNRRIAGANEQIVFKVYLDVLYFFMQNAVGTDADYNTTDTVDLTGSFHHLALVRNGTNVYMFLDGISQTLTVNNAIESDSMTAGTSTLNIGANVDAGQPFTGWFDEVRISKGIARWTANFTPPTSEYDSNPAASQKMRTVIIM